MQWKIVFEAGICTLVMMEQVGRGQSWNHGREQKQGVGEGPKMVDGGFVCVKIYIYIYVCVCVCVCIGLYIHIAVSNYIYIYNVLRIIMAHTFIHCCWNWQNYSISYLLLTKAYVDRKVSMVILPKKLHCKRSTSLGKCHRGPDWWGRD